MHGQRRVVFKFSALWIAACLWLAAAAAATAADLDTQTAIAPCQDVAAADFDSIRTKADLSRTAADSPPPFRIVLNDTFATASERGAIARWIKLENRCRRGLEMPRAVNIMQAPTSRRTNALSRLARYTVIRLAQALYFQELTYGEFARQKYQFACDLMSLDAALDEAAGRGVDAARLQQTVQQLVYLRRKWSLYLRSVETRVPGTVHIRGSTYT